MDEKIATGTTTLAAACETVLFAKFFGQSWNGRLNGSADFSPKEDPCFGFVEIEKNMDGHAGGVFERCG